MNGYFEPAPDHVVVCVAFGTSHGSRDTYVLDMFLADKNIVKEVRVARSRVSPGEKW